MTPLELEMHADRMGALGHPARLQILRLLVRGGPAGVAAGEVQVDLGIPASTLSHHLGRLEQAGLVSVRAEGTFRRYAPDYGALRALSDFLWEDCCSGGTQQCS